MTDETNDATTNLGEVSNLPTSTPPQNGVQQVRTVPDLKNDIAKILEKVKMPDRRGDVAPTKPSEAKIIPQTREIPSVTEIAVTEKDTLTPVHTFKDDVVRITREQKISLVKAVSMEEDRRKIAAVEPQKTHDRVKKRAVVPIIAVGFLVFTIASCIYLFSPRASAPNHVTEPVLLFSEQQLPVVFDQENGIDVRRILSRARTERITLGSLLRIEPRRAGEFSQPMTSFEFLSALETNAPENFLRSLNPDFFVGVHSVDVNAPVLILTIRSYEDAFAGMLAWEQNINTDLAPLFTEMSTFTNISQTPERRVFHDEVIQNYDIRAMKTDDNAIGMYYSFPSRNILIIAESPFSFTEIITRLKAQRML